jgi:hypothetical protein
VAENKIVLHPVDPWAILQDPSLLLDALRQRGLIGAAYSHFGDLHYKAGPRFRELVSFKAAAPAAGGEPPHVSLLETMADPGFLGGANTQLPQCPGCQGRLADWRAQLAEWQLDRHGYLWTCRRCGRKLRVEQLDWVRNGGIARYALDLWGIHENEAVPSPELLEALRVLTAKAWTYFYYRL